MTIHKEGYPTLIYGFLGLLALNIILYLYVPGLFYLVLILSILVYIFLISFFRSPDRSITDKDNSTILSPCDGKVVVIEQVFEPEFLKEKCTQISIFMSPLNVHINWIPTDADILYSKYHPGKFLVAWHPKASTDNERTTVCYQQNGKKLLLRQVAGAMARRIVNYAKEGDHFEQGQQLGFIKFGSRVDLFLPLDAELRVNIGDKVTGNRSIIARW
ncbi:MAG: phosphatidylserine decarboxylase family protein [Saprospiraceae bacterium]|nr:MAG: phosphatidylserine decarboxylase proenzyme [Bacteroidetes bacterium OLB9]MCO6462733.1 phosphatidylserine decarboxylase family protein [Saprospiraceae bacterium]MCZ2340141.1 phosphatidylserine decarboxylase family protein [Chitinophagales bacterium]